MDEEKEIKKIKTTRKKIIIILGTIIVLLAVLNIITIDAINKREVVVYHTARVYCQVAIKKYIGDSIKGSGVKELIEEIILDNNQYSYEQGRFISLHNGAKANRENQIAAYKENDELDKACEAANIYENENAENNQINIDAATEHMRKFKQKISSGKNYKVEAAMQDDIIYAVYISQIKNKGE